MLKRRKDEVGSGRLPSGVKIYILLFLHRAIAIQSLHAVFNQQRRTVDGTHQGF